MIDNVVDQYISHVGNSVLKDQMQIIPLAYLMQKDIPKSVKHYFDREVENWILEEEVKFESSERFDYDIPEVRMYIDKIFDHLKNTATFSLNNFNKLLERAIKLEKDFTIKPHQTMNNFLFKDSNTIRTKEINDTLNYFFVHNHYKEKLTEYFNLKYMQEINIEQFKELIKQIDDKIFSANMIEEALKMAQSIIDFINHGEDVQDQIPADILVTAFEDRYLTDFADLFRSMGENLIDISRIEETLHKGGKDESTDEVATVEDIDVSKVQIIEDEDDEDDEDDEIEEFEDIEDDEQEDNDVEEIETATDTVVEEEQISQVEVQDNPIIEEPEAINQVPDEPEPVVEKSETPVHEEQAPARKYGEVNDEAAHRIADVVASNVTKAANLEDLNKLIDRKWRKKFLKKLFKKDENFYTMFIADLNKLSSWKDASVKIEDVFYEKEVNPYSKEAIMFSDIAYQRFFPKSEY